jgi:hypothetical protein
MFSSLFGCAKVPAKTNVPKAIPITTGKRKTSKAVFCTAILLCNNLIPLYLFSQKIMCHLTDNFVE